MSRLFSVLLPITRPPVLLSFAIESVLEQSVADFELLVICDGAPPETVACAQAYAQRDARVKVFPFPKGARHGEGYRDRVLAGASGRNVAQICDDDLWMPNHLEEMERLLSVADFGNLLHVYVRPNGAIEVLPGDLGLPEMRQRMIDEPYNFFGLSFAGYRLEAYRRLPEGWAPAPAGIWTDLFMWRKFLAMNGAVFATRAAVTALHFATPEWHGATLDQRQDENRRFLERIRDPLARSAIVEAAWHSLLDRALERDRVSSSYAAEHSRMTLEISAMQTDIVRVAASRDELQGQLACVRKSREDLETEVTRLGASRDALKAKLKWTRQRLATKQNEVSVMLESRSWRLAAPLRKLAALMRRMGRRSPHE